MTALVGWIYLMFGNVTALVGWMFGNVTALVGWIYIVLDTL